MHLSIPARVEEAAERIYNPMTEEKKPTINYDKFCWMPGDFMVSDPPAKKPGEPGKEE
jgi:hypothetical protein